MYICMCVYIYIYMRTYIHRCPTSCAGFAIISAAYISTIHKASTSFQLRMQLFNLFKLKFEMPVVEIIVRPIVC